MAPVSKYDFSHVFPINGHIACGRRVRRIQKIWRRDAQGSHHIFKVVALSSQIDDSALLFQWIRWSRSGYPGFKARNLAHMTGSSKLIILLVLSFADDIFFIGAVAQTIGITKSIVSAPKATRATAKRRAAVSKAVAISATKNCLK